MFPRWFFLMPDSPSQMKLGKESRFRSHKTCRFGVGQSQLCHCLAAWVQWGTVLTGEQQHGAAHIPQQVSAWCPVPLLKEDPWGLYPSAGQATVTQQCSSWHSTEEKQGSGWAQTSWEWFARQAESRHGGGAGTGWAVGFQSVSLLVQGKESNICPLR